MNGSYTETVSIMEDGPPSYQPSTRYIGTLRSHSPSRRASSAISKTYKAASTLYLTRRLSEALHTIEPLVSVTKSGLSTTGSGGDDDEPSATSTLPPIATATRSLRIKVWNFYLTLLNAIIELGPEEGKADFGGAVWRAIVAKVRDGSVWEEVVSRGYGGREGSVDADVVANLSTLLLGQSPSQELNQQRLETYLSLSGGQPELALADRLSGFAAEGRGEPPQMQRRPSAASGANTPRDLNSRAKVLELYTLHVLPRNDEWDTAREFIRASNELDDERKDAFLYTLDTLHDQARDQQDRERELLRERDEELARQRAEAEAKRLEESRLLDEQSRASEAASRASEVASQASSSRGVTSSKAPQHVRANSETDYGIDDSRVRSNNNSTSKPPLRKRESTSKALRGTSSTTGSGGTGIGGTGSSGAGGKSLPRAARPKKTPPKSAIRRIPIVLGMLQRMLANAVRTMTKDPQLLMRNLLFVIALLLAFANRGIRERVGRITGVGWSKVKATIGMGTKVSYI